MQKTLIIRGKNITDADIGLIRSLVKKYGNRNRNIISKWCCNGSAKALKL